MTLALKPHEDDLGKIGFAGLDSCEKSNIQREQHAQALWGKNHGVY